jgi:hypothetical protein
MNEARPDTGSYRDPSGRVFILGHRVLQREGLGLLPLFLDLANPSPSQGWAPRERRGFGESASADAILALALVHHLAIGRNIPLDEVVAWPVGLAPNGIIEFVPKADPMVHQRLLRLREDIFDDYSEETFSKHLQARAEIVQVVDVSATGRRLFWFARRWADAAVTEPLR